MPRQFLASLGIVAAALVTFTLAAVVVGGRVQTTDTGTHRTPWGDPDLQGVWTNATRTPLERPEVLGDRAYLTDEEVATLQARASELFNGETDRFGHRSHRVVV